MKKLLTLLMFSLFIVACGDDDSPTAPSDATTRPATNVSIIEYRVSGNATSAVIRHSNSVDGFTQVTTSLPYVISLKTDRDSIFLSLEATPTSYPFTVLFPFLSAQIFVNGDLFREAVSTNFSITPILINGTYRKP